MNEMSVLQLFPKELRAVFELTALQSASLEEIRIRAEKPVLIRRQGEEFFLDEKGREQRWTAEGNSGKEEKNRGKEENRQPLCISSRQLELLFAHLCQYSPYAYGEELKKGFLTVAGGHRIGVAGQVVADAAGIRGIRNIRSVNIRISHEIKGCADEVVPLLYETGTNQLYNVLIISPPGMGKTTLLRDIVRQISDGTGSRSGKTVAVIDERSEIAGCFLGKPQNDVGMRTDVMDACPKAAGMVMMLRSMAPAVMAVDEIATEDDVRTLLLMIHCGIRILATVHGDSLKEIMGKPYLKPLFETDYFGRFLLLESKYKRLVYDRKGVRIL